MNKNKSNYVSKKDYYFEQLENLANDFIHEQKITDMEAEVLMDFIKYFEDKN
jgi:hypothetical protein